LTEAVWPKKTFFTGLLGRRVKESGCFRIVRKKLGIGIC
jgi:hypothetical protein